MAESHNYTSTVRVGRTNYVVTFRSSQRFIDDGDVEIQIIQVLGPEGAYIVPLPDDLSERITRKISRTLGQHVPCRPGTED